MAKQMFEFSRKMFELSRESAQRFKAEEIYGLPVDSAVAFSNHECIYKPAIEREQRKLLKKLGFLAPFLFPGETILLVTPGCAHASFVEQILTGVLLGTLKRTLLVVTNKRILHIPTTYRLAYRYSISQIMFADCRKIRISFSALIAKYKSGRTERFRCISRGGRKKIKAILKTTSLEGRASPTLERTHICPSCTKPLIKGCCTCPNCSLKFKTHAWATTLSILFPGGGYFYTRHPFLGIFAAAMEFLFAFFLVFTSIVLVKNYSKEPRYLGQAIVVCVIILIYEKLVTSLFSGKCVDEFIPEKRHVEVQVEKVIADRAAPQLEDMLATGWRSV
ncbi:MAG: hypothetical protein ABSB91_06600 [Sedimentisphaerales bacterium]